MEFQFPEKEKLNIFVKDLLELDVDKKYYLSEKARHDVGWSFAERNFIEHYLDTWAAGFKAAYCGHVCPDRNACELNGNRVLSES
jgi:hypothetical protein